MDFISPIIEVVKSLWTPCVRQVKYLKDLEENVKTLKRKMGELTSREKDVRIEVDRANLQLRIPKNEVNNWLESVVEMKDLVTGVENEFRENKRCLKGCLPNCYSRRKLGKRTLKMIVEVEELKKKSVFEDGVSIDPLPGTMPLLPTTPLVGKTPEMTCSQIWDCLMDKKIGIIGIHGMGGVGKTTIMKTINNRLKITEHFNTVIWLSVSKNFTLISLQSDIAKKIDLPLSEGLDEESRSAKLQEALLRRKSFVLIFDDMWSAFMLEDIGIPRPSVDNGCKLVLTTRSFRVCQQMETQIDIKVEVLLEEEAWTLFQDKVGTKVLLDQDVQDVAKLVASECGGLPLAIVTVGRALRNIDDVGEWRNALNQLRSSSTGIEGMEDVVFRQLKFSFMYLRNDMLRVCFLYCALYPEDTHIHADELINRWILEGLIIEMKDRQAEMDNGRSILNELKRACMLENGDHNDSVTMHDLMRDMAIDITRNSPHFIVQAGIRLEEPPTDKEWAEDVERVSLMLNRIKMITSQPKCPRLLTLFLNRNPLLEIHHSFFQQMHKLQVLDLSLTNIEMLPESLTVLENLRELNLLSCRKLNVLPSMSNLMELRKLELSWTSIEELPESLSDMYNLRELNVAGCEKIDKLPSLTKLKELRTLDLSYTCIEELPESVSNLENLHKLCLDECEKLSMVPSMAKLRKLRELILSSTSIKELPEGIERLVELRTLDISFTGNLKRFPVGLLPKLSLLQKFCTKGSACLWSSDAAEMMEGRIGVEEVTRLTRLTNVSSDFTDITSFSKYITFLQGRISKTEFFDFRLAEVNTEATSRGVDFLFTLNKDGRLRIKQFHDIVQLTQFLLDLGAMEIVELINCVIKSCNGMECLLVTQDGPKNNRNLLLPKVNYMEIDDMPNLQAFHRGTELDGTLKNLQYIAISRCPKLKNVFSAKLFKSLQNLTVIEVSDCDAMEEVVAPGEDDKNDVSIITLPWLHDIKLDNLPALKGICSRTVHCSTLRSIQVTECPCLKSIPLVIDKLPPKFDATFEGTREWWDALDWVDPTHTKALLQPYFYEEER